MRCHFTHSSILLSIWSSQYLSQGRPLISAKLDPDTVLYLHPNILISFTCLLILTMYIAQYFYCLHCPVLSSCMVLWSYFVHAFYFSSYNTGRECILMLLFQTHFLEKKIQLFYIAVFKLIFLEKIPTFLYCCF